MKKQILLFTILLFFGGNISILAQAPGGVTGAAFWIKSDDAGTIATAWKDNSANANNIPNIGGMTLSAADRSHNFYPYTTGYTASKHFRNTASVINGSAVTNPPSNYSLFSAVRPTSVASGRIMGLDDDTNAYDPNLSINANGFPNQSEYWNVNAAGTTGGAGETRSDHSKQFSVGAVNIFSGTANNYTGFGGTSTIQGGERRLGLNGAYENFSGFPATNTFQLVSNRLQVGYGGFAGGTAPSVSGAFPGDIMEAIWFNRVLTANEQSRVNSYLAIKNGVSSAEDYLTSSSNVVWSITTNAGYNNNIFGLARDNNSALHQKQAGSTNVLQKLVISTTGFANSNALNTVGLNDQQFLMIGDNGLDQKALSKPLVYTGANGKTNYRFEAIWKVQNTGSVGTVTVAWPKSFKNLYLVQSGDETFDTVNDTFTPMTTEVTINGVVYNTANVTLGDGQYFTFAGLEISPGGVPGQDFWVKSDDAGTIATAWKDHSHNADNIPNVGGMTLSAADRNHNFYPYTTGYTTTKYFQNNSSLLNGMAITNRPSNYSMFSAVRPTSAAAGRIMGLDDETNAFDPNISINANGFPNQSEYWNVNAAGTVGGAGETRSDHSSPFFIGTSNIFSATANNYTGFGGSSTIQGGERRLGLNGAYQNFSGFPATNTFQFVSNHLQVGYGGFNGSTAPVVGGAFPGDIMEAVWYNRLLTPNEQTRVNSYLAVKNGTTLNEDYLDTASTSVWSRTTNTGYNNNIFGIAKDEFTALDHKQSGSVNSGQKLVISTTGFADNNAANTTSLPTDRQYLLTGDNGLEQKLKTPLVYTAGSNGTTNYRFESIWKVQNSGNVGTVTVAWPKSVKNLYLVQSPDATFDGTDTFTSMVTEVTVNGVVYNTANVTLADGQFFTFAGYALAPGGVLGEAVWLRADMDVTVNAGKVDAWVNQGFSTGNAVPANPANGKSNYANTGHNFNPVVVDNTTGTHDGLILPNVFADNSQRALSSFVVQSQPTASVARTMISYGDNLTSASSLDNPWFATNTATTLNVFWQSNGGASTQTFPNSLTRYNNIQTINSYFIPKYTGATNTSLANSIGMNGSRTSFNRTANATTLMGYHLYVHQDGGNNNTSEGSISEVISYDLGLSTDEQQRIDSYLAIKYGITLYTAAGTAKPNYLDTASGVVWNASANTTYNNNIFGVAKDDVEAFEQKVSKSVNTGTILTLATINDFVLPNLDASRTGFTNDKTYFLLGDNNITSGSLTTMTISGTTMQRIQRTWLSQRTNTAGTLYFEADLSSYGNGFENGNNVKMIIADDDAFTTNVQQVTGTYTNGKWVFSNNFNPDNTQRYITFARSISSNCVTGNCNPNTYVNSSDPNTIEYDNMVSTFHSTISKEADGSFNVWGERTAADGTSNVLSPLAITPANGYSYTGTPLRATGGSESTNGSQFALLTTNGLYVWGTANIMMSSTIKSTTAFGPVTINGKTDGLPAGVAPADVKMMFGGYRTLGIVTCTGEAWVLSFYGTKNGDGTPEDATNNVIWHRVKTSATGDLNNVVAMRGGTAAFLALTSDGKLYTWGTGTYINDGAASATRTYATEVTVPAGVTPKMIGLTAGAAAALSYNLLATDGRIYTMGVNNLRQLGDGTTTTRTNWVQPQKPASQGQGTGALVNIAWISPQEHDAGISTSTKAVNVLTNDHKQWAWGANDSNMIGGPVAGTNYDPLYMPGNSTATDGMSLTDEIIAVETGGHTTINIKTGENKFGYVGHYINGSAGNGTATSSTVSTYTYNTATLLMCGAVASCPAGTTAPSVNTAVSNNCPAITVNLNTQAFTGTIPANITLQWYTDATHTSSVAAPAAVGAGTYYAFYYSSAGDCYSPASSPVTVTINGCGTTTPSCSTADPMPVNLNTLTVAPAPSGSAIQWHNSATPSASTLLSSTTVMATSTPTNYWAYYYDATNNCYSPGSKATVVSNACCSYPTVDLAALPHSAVPAGAQLVWYTTYNHASGTQVTNPTAVGNGTYWPFFYDPSIDCYSPVGTPVLVAVDNVCSTACYKPGITAGTALDTKVGITALSRAGATDADNWPMARKGGWIALEAKTKGFVPNRVAFSGGNPVGIAAADFVEGMMVYDTTNKCMKIYTLKTGDASMAWHCVSTQTCPD